MRFETDLIPMARRHSRQMYRAGYLFHTSNLLGDLISVVGGLVQELVGENVAVASTIYHVQELFMDSPPHRRNILNPVFDTFGVGAITRDAQVWVTVLFVG